MPLLSLTLANEEQPKNALFPIAKTLSGIVISINDEQSLNAS